MTKLVGILNVTPDSFYDGGKFVGIRDALRHAKELFDEGADMVDIGAEATNPWAAPITSDEEWKRLELVLPELIRAYPGKISLDTYHPETAERALQIGPVIINDVTMFRDPAMIAVAAQFKAHCIVSHIPDKTIQEAHANADVSDVTIVRDELLAKRDELIHAGVPAENIILDPGIGFGKTMELNIELLRFAERVPGIPVMIGHSNKRVIAVMSGKDKTDIEANLAAAQIAMDSGAVYLRVHNITAHRNLLTSDQ